MKVKLSLLLLGILLAAVLAVAQPIVTDKQIDGIIDPVKDTQYLDKDWASITASPSTAYSTPSIMNFTQKITVCNKATDEGYLFLDYNFNHELTLHSLKEIKQEQIVSEQNNPITTCEEKGEYPDNSTICSSVDNYENVTSSYTTRNELEPTLFKNWDNEIHYVITKGTQYQAGECKDYILNYKPVTHGGKWNMRVWGNIEDDYSCVEQETCPYDYILDPTFSTAFLYKQQINITNTDTTINNYTATILLTTTNFNTAVVQADFDDVLFTNFDESVRVGCYKFNHTASTNATFDCLITNFSNSVPTSVWAYYGNSTMPNQNPECNDGYLLCDLMKGGSINTTIWNDYVGSKWSANSTGGYLSASTVADSCGTFAGQANSMCILLANTTGVLKQSQQYESLVRFRAGNAATACGSALLVGKTINSDSLGADNLSLIHISDEGITRRIFYNFTLLTSIGSLARYATTWNAEKSISTNFTSNSVQWLGSNNLTTNGLSLPDKNTFRPNGSNAALANGYLNNSNKMALFHTDGSGASGACTASGTQMQWDYVIFRSFLNSSPTLSFGTETPVSANDASINITNQTWNTVIQETALANYTVNVSWNANVVNYVMANFTVGYSTAGVFTTSIINGSGSNGGNMNWTQFNISLRLNFTDNTSGNLTGLPFRWNFTIDTNATDLVNQTSSIIQDRIWSYWINNVTWTTPVLASQSNTFHFNLTKIIPQTGIVGLAYNVTLQYNGVNQTPVSTLILNSTNYEDYDFTMTAPVVSMNTVSNWTAWITVNYQARQTIRSNRTNTIIVNGTQLVLASAGPIINNETFETTGLFDSGGISNYSIDISWDANAFNNITKMNFSINGFTYRDNQTTNVTVGNRTVFNISVYTPMVNLNATTIGFNWSWQADGNATNQTGNSSNRSQNVNWGWYVNNLTYVSPIASMSPNNILVNFTKHVATPPGLYVNVTNEWNLTASVSTSSFAYKKNVQVNSTQAYQAVNNYTVNVLLNLSNHNFNRTQPDGDDVAFYNFDQTTLLGCYKESFVNTTMGNYSVLITNLSNATNTSIWVYYSNTTMPNQCPEINNAYLLADLMNSSSINTSIWNEKQSTFFSPDTTNGSYKTVSPVGTICSINGGGFSTSNCFMSANTSGVFKQSQNYQVDTRMKFEQNLGCGGAVMFSQNQTNGIGSPNMSFRTEQFLGTEYTLSNQNNTDVGSLLSSVPSTVFINYRYVKINNNDARTLYNIFNSTTLSSEINLGSSANGSTLPNDFLNNTNKIHLVTVGTVCSTVLWDEVRVRSYINSTLNYTFGTETIVVGSASSAGVNRTATQLLTNTSTYEEWNLTFSTPIVYQTTNVSTKGWLNISFNGTYVIRDPTFIQVVNPFSNFSYETPLYETSLANFTFNVTNSSPVVNVNFTWNTTQFNSSNITNTSAGSTTIFNISIRLPLIPSNQSNYTFQWNLTLSNGTLFNSNLTNQTLLFAYYPNAIHKNASEIEGSTQNQIVNVTKHLFAAGVQEYVNLEYNQTNYSSSLYVNSTNYQDYNSVFSTPLVSADVVVQEKGWLNISFGASSIDGNVVYLRNTSNTTQTITNINITGGFCSSTAGYNTVINFTFFDEFSNKTIKQNGSDQITIWSNNQQSNQTVGFNFINTNYTEICIACLNCNLTSNFNIQYSDNETVYTLREYWERLYNFNTTVNNTRNITLYNLLNQNATEIIFNVNDANEDPIQNMIVQVLKYNISNNSFKIVDTEITDFDGKARVRLFQADDYYKVRLIDGNNTIVLETTLFKLLFTEYFISVIPLTTDIRTVIRLTQIPHNLTFDNGTKIITLSWNDIENVTNNNCLEIVNITDATGNIINKQCSSNRSGSFSYNFTNINGSYVGKYTVGDNSFLIDAIQIVLRTFFNLGREGLWMAFLVIGTLAAIGLSIDPTVSIIFTLLGVITMSLAGLLPIGWLTMTGIVAAGVITALVINKTQ